MYILISTYAELVQTSFYQEAPLSVCAHKAGFSSLLKWQRQVSGIKIQRKKKHELNMKTEKWLFVLLFLSREQTFRMVQPVIGSQEILPLEQNYFDHKSTVCWCS